MGRRLWNLLLFFLLAVLFVFFWRLSSQAVLTEPPTAFEPFSREPTPVIPETVPPPAPGSGEARVGQAPGVPVIAMKDRV